MHHRETQGNARHALYATLLALLVAGLALTEAGCQRGPAARLIVFIVVDTLRADRLGCYGSSVVATPHLDRLAREGTLYESAFTAAPVTLPSVASMLTGAYPLQHGVRDNALFRLDESWDTVPERFADAGYATGAFLSADVLGERYGLGRGFEVYDADVSMRYRTHHPMMRDIEDDLQGVERRAQITIDRALAWAVGQAGRDAFLFVHLFDPHLPRDPVPEFQEAYPNRPYEAEVAHVDQQVGRLLEGLSEHWSVEDTWTLFVSDHGEGLSDHEEEFHGVLLFDETMHVPLIVHGKGAPSGQRRTEIVRTIDLAPTLCVWAGLNPPASAVGSLLPGIEYPDGPSRTWTRKHRTVAYLESMRSRLSHGWCELRGLRTGRWKYIDGPTPELYDVVADPGEHLDLAPAHPAVVDSLRRVLDDAGLYAAARGAQAAQTMEPSDEERERLLSLGYVTPDGGAAPTVDSLAVWYFPAGERGRELGLADPRERLREYMARTVARSFVKSGEAAFAAGDDRAALDFFQQALQSDPRIVSAHLGIAQILERNGRPDDALTALRTARQSVPASDRVSLALARTLRDRGKLGEALRVLEDAVSVARAAGRADSIFQSDLQQIRRLLGSPTPSGPRSGPRGSARPD